MPQIQLPVFPAGSTEINSGLAFECRDNQVTYFNGHLPVFTHAADDLASFRFFTTQLIINGSASQSEIVRAFGVSLTTVKRYTGKYRREGGQGFFGPPCRRRGSRLTPERLAEAQRLLDEGLEIPALRRQLGVLASTLHKAIRSGRLRVLKKKLSA
jgi:DNA invertase Pin-like site-specific DNA recombinase